MGKLYLGLVHHPINNKRGDVVTTSVTNLDIHDIARSCKTFAVERYYIITPLEAQHKLVGRILSHWKEDRSNAYNPDRQNALEVARLAHSVEDAANNIKELEGIAPKIVVTGANFKSFDGDTFALQKQMEIDKTPYLLLFGTGWGLNATVVESADYRLGPIRLGEYNHLSVRSAVAIYLDRLRRQPLS